MTQIASYRYDVEGRRIEYIDSFRGTTTRYYYDGQNPIREEDYGAGGALLRTRTYMHGTQYIDERAVMRVYEAESVQDHYYLLEALYSVAGLASANGQLAEANTYGNAFIDAMPPGDVVADGTVSSSDLMAVVARLGATNPLYDVAAAVRWSWSVLAYGFQRIRCDGGREPACISGSCWL